MEEKYKNCKVCGESFKMFNTIENKCVECRIKESGKKLPKPLKIISVGGKKRDKIKKGLVRGVDEITKLKVFTRDKGSCIICGTMNDLEATPHHVRFGPTRKRYDESDNSEENLVTICRKHHHQIHSGTEGGLEIQKKCEDYINNLYNNLELGKE